MPQFFAVNTDDENIMQNLIGWETKTNGRLTLFLTAIPHSLAIQAFVDNFTTLISKQS